MEQKKVEGHCMEPGCDNNPMVCLHGNGERENCPSYIEKKLEPDKKCKMWCGDYKCFPSNGGCLGLSNKLEPGQFHCRHEWQMSIDGYYRCIHCSEFKDDEPEKTDVPKGKYVDWTRDHLILHLLAQDTELTDLRGAIEKLLEWKDKELADLRAERDKLKEENEGLLTSCRGSAELLGEKNKEVAYWKSEYEAMRLSRKEHINDKAELKSENERLKELIKPFVDSWYDPESPAYRDQERLKSYLENK